MKTIVGSGVLVCLVVAAWFYSLNKQDAHRALPESTSLTVVHQSNRFGELEPCGCHHNPYGGADREANAVDQFRKDSPNLLYVDAGNFLAPGKLSAPLSHYQQKAQALVEIFNQAGLDAFAPGPNDYALGLRHLRQIKNKAGFTFLSTNVLNASGMTPVFQPMTVIEKGGIRYGLLSLADPKAILPEGLYVESPESALKKWLAKLARQSDVVVVLSQLPTVTHRELAKRFPEIRLFVGSDSEYASQEALWLAPGSALLVDSQLSGFLLGKLDLHLQFPFSGFSSESRVAENRAELQLMKEELKTDPRMETAIDAFQQNRQFEIPQGASTYAHELVKLDEKRFGAPNEITALIEKEKNRVRNRALAE